MGGGGEVTGGCVFADTTRNRGVGVFVTLTTEKWAMREAGEMGKFAERV